MASNLLQNKVDKHKPRPKKERRKKPNGDELSMSTSGICDIKSGHIGRKVTDRERRIKSKPKPRRDDETEGCGIGGRYDEFVKRSSSSTNQHDIVRDEEDRRMKERDRVERRQMWTTSSIPSGVGVCVEGDAGKVPHLIDDDLNTEFERLFSQRTLKKKRTRKKEGDRRKSNGEKYPEKMNCDKSDFEKVDCNSYGLARSATERNLMEMYLAQYRATSTTSCYIEEESLDPSVGGGSIGRLKRIHSWHQKYTLKKALELAKRTPEMDWLTSFYHCDPRWQILKFFNEVAREGGDAPMNENLASSPLVEVFDKATVFTVWRPTSLEAIRNMMLGIATGKGLDIKGKSAKQGNISSYVPFIQISEESQKDHVRSFFIKEGKTVRVYYQSESFRNDAYEMLCDMKDYMVFAAKDAIRVLSEESADLAEQDLAMKHLMYDDSNMNVEFVDTYVDSSHPLFGLDISERLFWESYVMIQDYSRPEGTEWDIGRKSELAFMDMNFKSLRTIPAPGAPRAVVYQMSKDSPMEPRMLLMAYEEYGRVKPVVSDFDCFLLGSRGVKYKNPIPNDQIELMRWSIANIGEVLDMRAASYSKKESWMDAWFKVLKSAALKGYYPKPPKYGNGDPKSYEIIEVAVSRLHENGCVRHGAECFNWFFPQEIDDEFLVISNSLPGKVKWKKVNVKELQDILVTKIAEGYTFPINPKWVLCDPGWRNVYNTLLASEKNNVQDSINCWLPPGTGLREEIDAISARHPLGFEATNETTVGEESMAKILDDFERYLKIQKAWRKLRLLLFWIRYMNVKRLETKEEEMAASS